MIYPLLVHLANTPVLGPQAQQGASVVFDFLGMITGGHAHGSAQERRDVAHAGSQMVQSMGLNLRAAIDQS